MSGHFSSSIGLLEDIDGEHYRLMTGFRYYLTEDEQGEWVDVPKNFITNFASTPRIVWAFLPPTGKFRQAAATHDKLFLANVIRSTHSARPCTWAEANRIFLDGSKALGVSWLTRKIMYRILQGFSRPAWDAYRRSDAAIGSVITLARETTPAELVAFEASTVAKRISDPTTDGSAVAILD